jgi:hypothetical protein
MFGLCLGHFFRRNQQMASHVAPGYNPEVSLLQGGNAPIVPVQGGGGMEAGALLPSDYNPSNSLLNVGASATIVPVKGGGQTGGDGEKAYKDFFLERYRPELTSISITTLTPEQKKAKLLALTQNYRRLIEPKLLELTSFLRDPQRFVLDTIENPLYKVCPTPGGLRNIPAQFFQRVRKQVKTITNDNPVIWILPNIDGDVSKFLQYMKLLSGPDGKIRENHYVICVGKFFSDLPEKNAELYIEFLEKKVANLESLFYLVEATPQFILASCFIYKLIYSQAYLGSYEGKQRPLVTYFEPDIILFRKQQIVLKASELPIQKNDSTVRVSEMLKKTPFEKYATVLIVPNIEEADDLPGDKGDAKPELKYFTFDYIATQRKTIEFPSKTEIVCPSGKTCNNFQGGYKLESLPDEKKLPGSELYVLYKNTDKMPFLKEAGAVLSKENLDKLGASKEAPKEAPKEVPKEAPKEASKEAPKEAPKLEETKEEEEEIRIPEKETFKESPTATKALEERTLVLNTLTFQIRFPLGNEEIKKDWQAGKFTQGEADFLNSLQIRPSLLQKAFGKKEGYTKLAEFLEKSVLSNCFEDTTLLSNIECSNSQQFIRQLYFTMFREILETMYDELGVLKPLNFMDLIAILKNLLKGKPKQLLRIFPSDFTGNFFDPFAKICYDKETNEFYADFAEIPDDLRSKFQFYRISGNLDTVFQQYFRFLEAASKEAKKAEEEEEEEEDAGEDAGEEEDAGAENAGEEDAGEEDAGAEDVPKGPTMMNKVKARFHRSGRKFHGALTRLGRAVSPAVFRFPRLFRSDRSGSRISRFFKRRPLSSEPPKMTAAEAAASSNTADNSSGAAASSSTAAASSSAAGTGLTLRNPYYKLENIGEFQPPLDFFTEYNTEPDGLCFYRAVLKGLERNPTANSKTPPVSYEPTKEETKEFVQRVKEKLEEIRNRETEGELTLEQTFDAEYAPKTGEEKIIRSGRLPFTAKQKKGRIPYKGDLYKMTFQEYLNLMDSENINDIPYAEMEASVGIAAAEVEDKLIALLVKAGTKYRVEAIYHDPKYETEGFPISKVIFLDHKDKNHYDTLKLKPGKVWPQLTRGGGEEEIFDLGEPIVRRYTRRNKTRKQK